MQLLFSSQQLALGLNSTPRDSRPTNNPQLPNSPTQLIFDSIMAPSKSTNFRTYEAQTRLLAAVIATANPKLDFNELAKHAGSNCTPSSIDHRLRPLKQLAQLQRTWLAAGKDPADLPTEKAAIQKLFGESTPAGLEWQFRDIKKLGKAQQAAVSKGESPVNVMGEVMGKRGAGSAVSTPSGRASKHAAAPTPGSRASTITMGTAASSARKRKAKANYNLAEDSNEVSDEDSDYSAKDVDLEATPSRKRNRQLGNGNPAAAMGGTSNGTPRVSNLPVGNGAQLFAAQPQQQDPVDSIAAGSPRAPQARIPAHLNVSPRKDIPVPHEVIDLSGGSPDAVSTMPMAGMSHVQHQQPHPHTIKAKLPVHNANTQDSTNGFTSSHTSSHAAGAAAFSFDGAGDGDDPFAGHDGYAPPSGFSTARDHASFVSHAFEDGYHDGYGQPTSDDEC
ncbi:uncharacterized protein B0I36DRAFT_106732 [Microdochium trichocladiopsis]|uniref:Uncharacterized protein n=1 Tax=Microdochium trichocladiopsis TaxID=1682393 RepID=A0A9P8Y9P1_9PEZI|nr:uncharacterized protein B0I36DRAFT_106732 [Microdochium trichocladiopsis]KAH7033261.1 hypothetical protein B0I36DRAFT_106732 [Microdochium trichocladiopsis]